MNPFFEKIYDEVEGGIFESAYIKSYRIRKWALVVSGLIYVVKSNSFLIQRIDFPYVELQLPGRAHVLEWASLLLAYLLLVYSINLFSVVFSEYFFLIERKRAELVSLYVKQRIEEKESVNRRLEQSLKTIEVLEERDADQISKPINREDAVREAYRIEAARIDKQFDTAEYFVNQHIRQILLPEIIVDIVRYSLVYVLAFYVYFWI